MNFVFLSPNFPDAYWNFCRGLKKNGVNTLAIGDCPYDKLNPNLKANLNEYYKVSSLENYDEVYRAFAYLTFKHGRIDWLESNNEYWLERDAKLRTDFHITTGIQSDHIDHIKYKSKMKEYYEKAGVKVARYHMVTTLEEGKSFIDQVGYPVVVKPDNGVGASTTFKLSNEEELNNFYAKKQETQFIMEEFVDGELFSYDGIAGKDREIIFETAHYYPDPVMEIVNDQKDVWFYSLQEIPKELKEAGQKVIASFESNSRFFHTEYFRLKKDKEGLGKKGDFIGLEVNMRPPGGCIPDMINYANDIDIYQIWADMVCKNHSDFNKDHRPYCCVYAGRRDSHTYLHSHEEIMKNYQKEERMIYDLPPVFATAMGNRAYIMCFENQEDAISFAHYALTTK